MFLSGGVFVQAPAPIGPGADFPSTTGAIIQNLPNITGNNRDMVVGPSAAGAETLMTDSAAGGISSQGGD
jgi:hypothetical protein